MIERRNAVALLALSLAAPGLAFAQKGATKMDPAEAKHAEQTLTVGAIALETSKAAQSRAQNAWVKKFADFEVAEQTTIAEILKAAGGVPGPASEKHASTVKKLAQYQSGAAFDSDYVSGQIEGHTELLKIQEDYIAAGNDAHHVAIAKLARGQIKEHLDLLQTIQRDLKA